MATEEYDIINDPIFGPSGVGQIPPTASEPALPNETAPVTDNEAYDAMKQMLEDYGLPVSLL